MSIFDSWENVSVVCRGYASSDRVKMTAYKDGSGDRRYRRLLVSRNLVEEIGKDQFMLKTNGSLYALVPNTLGQLHYARGRMLGISSAAVDVIVNSLGVEECSAKVVDGAIVFPMDNDFIL